MTSTNLEAMTLIDLFDSYFICFIVLTKQDNFLRDSKGFVDFYNEPFLCQITELEATQSLHSNPSSSNTVSSLSVNSSPKHISVLTL